MRHLVELLCTGQGGICADGHKLAPGIGGSGEGVGHVQVEFGDELCDVLLPLGDLGLKITL